MHVEISSNQEAIRRLTLSFSIRTGNVSSADFYIFLYRIRRHSSRVPSDEILDLARHFK